MTKKRKIVAYILLSLIAFMATLVLMRLFFDNKPVEVGEVKSLTVVQLADNTITTTAKLIAKINELNGTGGQLYLPNLTFDLGGATLDVKKMSLIGPAKISNGSITISSTQSVTISSLELFNTGVTVSGSTGVEIKNNTIRSISKTVLGAITIGNLNDGLLIKENKIYDIANMSMPNTYGSGIKMELVGATVKNVTINSNEFYNIHGPAGIWIGGKNSNISKFEISANKIYNTASFGIEFYAYPDNVSQVFSEINIKDNAIEDIGMLRPAGPGNGSGGIYSNFYGQDMYVTGNVIKRVTEVGIEGDFKQVVGNYIEDSGADQLNHPIGDNAGIYNGGGIVTDNTIINPGENGGVYQFSSGNIENKLYKKNLVKNIFSYWKSNTSYKVGDLVVSNKKWYVCTKVGTSGSSGPSQTTAGIVDGSTTWNYKKPLATNGIGLNAVNGLKTVTITDNSIVDLEQALYTSSLVSNISIRNNFQSNNLVPKVTFYGGYGGRTGTNVVYENSSVASALPLPALPLIMTYTPPTPTVPPVVTPPTNLGTTTPPSTTNPTTPTTSTSPSTSTPGVTTNPGTATAPGVTATPGTTANNLGVTSGVNNPSSSGSVNQDPKTENDTAAKKTVSTNVFYSAIAASIVALITGVVIFVFVK